MNAYKASSLIQWLNKKKSAPSFVMSESAEDDSSIRRKWKEYRERYKQQRKERLVTIAKLQEPISILDCIVTPGDVDMSSFCGTEAELVYAIETLYANDGR